MLIYFALVLLGIFNLMYFPAKFFGDQLPSFFTSFYDAAKENWALLIFLEFLMIASLFIDIILRYDKLTPNRRMMQLILTALFLSGFILKFFMGYMELYIDGAVE